MNTTAAGATTPSFAAQQTFAAGSYPHLGDGWRTSTATACPTSSSRTTGSNTVSVLLNTTAPGATTPCFAAQQTFATGSIPLSVTAADLNGDGKPDLIVANASSNTVSVLLNTTAPGATTPCFAAQQTFATGSEPVSVATADLNGDGKPDLIVANNGLQHGVGAAEHDGAGRDHRPASPPQQTFATGSDPASVAAADLNGDGKPDLIVANYGSNTVSVLLNTTAAGSTTPTFAAQQTFATGSDPVSVTAADVNGDGRPDLIVAELRLRHGVGAAEHDRQACGANGQRHGQRRHLQRLGLRRHQRLCQRVAARLA